jgi:alpha-L-rhamnosidase
MNDLTRRRFIGTGLGITASAAIPAVMFAESKGKLAPKELTCEQRSNPINVDEPQPRLSWKLMSVLADARAMEQRAYRLLVASSAQLLSSDQGDLWDSGKIQSNESILIAYSGEPLSSFSRCYWKVMVWDQDGAPSAWSEPALWENALVESKDWRGNWLMVPEEFLRANEPEVQSPIKLGQWIWPVSQSRVYMRKFFDLTGTKVKRAQLYLICDNEFRAFLNGQSIGMKAGKDAVPVDVTSLLKPTGNFWGVKAWQSNDPTRLSAAVRAGLQIEYEDGTVQNVLSDISWQFGIMGTYFANADPEDWNDNPAIGGWSGPPTAVDIHPKLLRRSVLLRRNFKIEEPVVEARLYATAWGLYDLSLNGARVGDSRLAPGCSEKVQYYQTYDVTKQLHQGDNAIGAMLGSGWLNSRYYGDLFCHKSAFRAHLRITLASGKIMEVGTDSSWTLHFSPLVDNDLQWGERYDARLEIPGWNTPGFQDTDWTKAEVATPPGVPTLRSQPFESICVKAEVKATKVSKIGDTMYLFDFEQNAPGRGRLVLKDTKPGQLVIMKYGERLGEGGRVEDDVYSDVFYPADNNWETGKARFMTRNLDTYICRGAAEEIYEPRFAYTGFRYGQISGFTGSVDAGTMTQLIFHTDIPVTGTFETSNPLVNDIWKAIVWSTRGNHHSGPTDCPTREKNFWNGDTSVFAETACWYGDFSRLYTAWTVSGRKVPAQEVAWTDEIVTVPWMMYAFYGDLRSASQHYEAMTALVDGRLSRAQDHLYIGQGDTSIGDHVSTDPVPHPFFNGAIHNQSIDRLGQLAAALGKQGDAEKYRQAGAQARLAFEGHFFGDDGRLNIAGSQSAYVMALAFDLVKPESRKQIAAAFMESVAKKGYHPSTGFVCTPYLLPLVTECGGVDAAWKMVTQETSPSWGFMLKSGSTTMTETWEAYNAPVGSGTSMNHFGLGSIGRWFFEYIGGIRLDFSQPGFRKLQFMPYLPQNLQSAQVSFESVRGPVRSAWKKQDGMVEWQISVPPNTAATVLIPHPRPSEVREGKRPLSAAMQATVESDRTRLLVGSGRYLFRWPSA